MFVSFFQYVSMNSPNNDPKSTDLLVALDRTKPPACRLLAADRVLQKLRKVVVSSG